MISNSLDIDLIKSDIHDRSCKKQPYPWLFLINITMLQRLVTYIHFVVRVNDYFASCKKIERKKENTYNHS